MRIRSAFFKREFDLAKAQLVGKGTFAQVFRVFDAELKESLAIRRVKKSMGDPDDIAKEKQINEELRKVDNQNILKIYDIIEQPDTVWYITEYCSGGSLWDALNLCPDNRLDERQSLQCILQVSKGVQELHNHRITHRDLKPENILLKTKYTPGKHMPVIKLADFGLSTQKIIMETIAGTKEYIAPEQAKFHNYTNAVDVWSLGIILDQILHGTPFYSGEDNKEVFSKILKTPFKVRDEGLRPAIKELLMSLLKKKPYERPIIAVIRSTVQKILQQMDEQKQQVPTSSRLTHHKSTSIEHVNHILPASEISKLNSESKINKNSSQVKLVTPTKENNSVFSKKVYEMGTKEKLIIAKDITLVDKDPVNKGANSERKMLEVAKVVSPVNLNRDQHPHHKLAIEKQNTIRSDIVETDRSKIQRKPISKVQSATKSPQPLVLTQKITIVKSDHRRKMMNSSIRKDDLRSQVVSLQEYGGRMVKLRGQLLSTELKLVKQLSFIPNTYLSGNDFNQCPQTQLPIQEFKRHFTFLNCINTSQDYEIRLLTADRQLQALSIQTQQQLFKVHESLRQIFFNQLDIFIDQFLQKVLK